MSNDTVVEIANNTCQGNAYHGIQFLDQSTGRATGNTCSGNLKHGIAVENESLVALAENVCADNADTEHSS